MIYCLTSGVTSAGRTETESFNTIYSRYHLPRRSTVAVSARTSAASVVCASFLFDQDVKTAAENNMTSNFVFMSFIF